MDVENAKILVVGAGGIGCELLKNLALSGFRDIEIIDLDTIDVSNLNRQFLFRKEHVGKPKSVIARSSILELKPDIKVTAYHNSIMSKEYDVKYFQQFTIVMNALDNRAARSHVNRICLAAKVPLIESGSAGYLGQVTVIGKGLTECYDCQPKAPQKTFPGCTIRNTPSAPIHCIVWAKHLFNQLFGEEDADDDVSPDTEDPELASEAGAEALKKDELKRTSTRKWAKESEYNPEKLFKKLFSEDIKYLLSMEKLWSADTNRKPPTPLDWNQLPSDDANDAKSNTPSDFKDQRVWSVLECREVFSNSLKKLRDAAESKTEALVWDKDDTIAMDFVTACANLRSYIFGIDLKSRFDVKSMAGNIIPAIASTNAIIAGLMVLQAYKLLEDKLEECKLVYLNKHPNVKGKLVAPCQLDKPKPTCYVCGEKPEASLACNVNTMSVRTLVDLVIKEALSMVSPDIMVDDGTGTVLVSSDPEDGTEVNLDKTLSEFGIQNGSRLQCQDDSQDYKLTLEIVQTEKFPENLEYLVSGDPEQLKAQAAAASAASADAATSAGANGVESIDVDEIEEIPQNVIQKGLKRKEAEEPPVPAKKAKSAPVELIEL
ncbi:SUMO-activating enzyme subunit 2-like [Artemia franciscana]|uniref:SUMO-activating enzyme subunit n=1 Tax=Artemia franciscana TaxID=6661 RepID=A0AA88I988_ARTSF|nr:hypothetical protein QYM36_003086 [Artemia franciscana]